MPLLQLSLQGSLTTITLAANSPTVIAFVDVASVSVAGAIPILHVSRPASSTNDEDKR